MAKLNLKLMQEKLAKLNKKTGGSYLKIEDGKKNLPLRIVPDKDGDPFKEFYFHYRMGEGYGSVLCPKMNSNGRESCAICDFVATLYKGGEVEKEHAKEIKAKNRYYSNVIDRENEGDGVQTWGYSKTVYRKLIETCLDEEYGDITDIDEGFDLRVSKTKDSGKAWFEVNFTPSRKESSLSDDPEKVEKWVESQPDISFKEYTSEEVEDILEQYIATTTGVEGEESRGGGDDTEDKKNKMDAIRQQLSGD